MTSTPGSIRASSFGPLASESSEAPEALGLGVECWTTPATAVRMAFTAPSCVGAGGECFHRGGCGAAKALGPGQRNAEALWMHVVCVCVFGDHSGQRCLSWRWFQVPIL